MNLYKLLGLYFLIVSLAACADGERQAAPSAQPASTQPASTMREQPTPASPPVAALSEVDLARIATEVMEREYPDAHDVAGKCWRYVLEIPARDEEVAYCMRPQHVRQVPGKAGVRRVYFFAANANDLGDDPDYNYSAVDSGLMAAFQVEVAVDGSWNLVASSKAMEFGTAGVCGCEQAKFTRLGVDYYGWMFTSGGIWQGARVSSHEIVAAHDGAFRNLSKIPEIREDAQDVRYVIEVLESDSAQEVYPLKVEKMESGTKVAERTLAFDHASWAYPGIDDF